MKKLFIKKILWLPLFVGSILLLNGCASTGQSRIPCDTSTPVYSEAQNANQCDTPSHIGESRV